MTLSVTSTHQTVANPSVFRIFSMLTGSVSRLTGSMRRLGLMMLLLAGLMIHPLADLIQPLVGDWGRTVTLLPAGMSVHGYEPDAAQLKLASQADLLVVVGRNLDGWAEDITMRAVGKRKLPIETFAVMLDGQAGLNQRKSGHPHHDHDYRGPNAHLWLDPVLTRQFIAQLAPKIAALAPDDQARQQTLDAAARLDERLAQLHQQYTEKLSPLTRRDMVTFHNAFDLLAARYGLTVAAHLTDVDLAPGGEVTASQLVEVIQTVRKLNLKAVYAEPQFPDRAIQVIRQETGATILRLDDLGGPGIPGYDSYFAMMQSNLEQLVRGQTLE
jgi:zinc transport system substrate-binding protein